MLFLRSSGLPEGFPLRTFRVGALLMSGMVAALVLLNLWVEHNIRQTVRDGAALSAAVDELKDYGSNLGFAIRAVVSSGDERAIAEYHSTLPVLSRAMSDLRLLLRDDHMDSAANDLADTDRWLVRKEVGAIELARRGRLEEAEAIIDAPDYQRAART